MAKWILGRKDYPNELMYCDCLYCSDCDYEMPTTTHGELKWHNYCPNCGAKMENGDNE